VRARAATTATKPSDFFNALQTTTRRFKVTAGGKNPENRWWEPRFSGFRH